MHNEKIIWDTPLWRVSLIISSLRVLYILISLAVGRWQKGRDLNWYSKGADSKSEAESRAEEIRQIKQAEETARRAALGLTPIDNANMVPLGSREGEKSARQEGPEVEAERNIERTHHKRRRHRSRDNEDRRSHSHRETHRDRDRRRSRSRERDYRKRHDRSRSRDRREVRRNDDKFRKGRENRDILRSRSRSRGPYKNRRRESSPRRRRSQSPS